MEINDIWSCIITGIITGIILFPFFFLVPQKENEEEKKFENELKEAEKNNYKLIYQNKYYIKNWRIIDKRVIDLDANRVYPLKSYKDWNIVK